MVIGDRSATSSYEEWKSSWANSVQLVSDPDTATIRNYQLLHTAGGPSGTDISRPAEFLVDQNGIVRWSNFTEDIRIRARGNEMLAEARKIN